MTCQKAEAEFLRQQIETMRAAILHSVETSERLHPTSECCVEWQQEIEALRAAVQGQGQGPVVARLRRASDWPEIIREPRLEGGAA